MMTKLSEYVLIAEIFVSPRKRGARGFTENAESQSPSAFSFLSAQIVLCQRGLRRSPTHGLNRAGLSPRPRESAATQGFGS
jgi:hypothetical protein